MIGIDGALGGRLLILFPIFIKQDPQTLLYSYRQQQFIIEYMHQLSQQALALSLSLLPQAMQVEDSHPFEFPSGLELLQDPNSNLGQLQASQSFYLCLTSQSHPPPSQSATDSDSVAMPLDIFLSSISTNTQALKPKSRPELGLKLCRSQRPCVICQEQIKRKSVVFSLECRHYFHRDCLRKWHEKHSTCPLCRKELG